MARLGQFLLLAILLGEASGALAQVATVAVPDTIDRAAPVVIYGQVTNVTQYHDTFPARYSGPNSLSRDARFAQTTDATAYAGTRLWRDAELWINPEVDEGYGFDNTLGTAGYPSGEAYKVGSNAPYLRIPRLFVRQTLGLGGDALSTIAGPNQMGVPRAEDALVITAGKFSVVDIFDANRYAHDPRGDFLNWSVIDAGAFDYAADSWGFTYGASTEWIKGPLTIRLGYFALSPQPNGKIVVPRFGQWMEVFEIERRFQFAERQGAVRFLAFRDRARMGRYEDAIAHGASNGTVPATADVRHMTSKTGYAINFEQELGSSLGVFARLSSNDGHTEAYEFTEINRSVQAGLSIAGNRWGRSDDRIGLAAVRNDLSTEARHYFEAGGIGILIGDGALRYGSERIAEAYYDMKVSEVLRLAIDLQRIENPAYNRDRGPVSVIGSRIHLDF